MVESLATFEQFDCNYGTGRELGCIVYPPWLIEGVVNVVVLSAWLAHDHTNVCLHFASPQ